MMSIISVHNKDIRKLVTDIFKQFEANYPEIIMKQVINELLNPLSEANNLLLEEDSDEDNEDI